MAQPKYQVFVSSTYEDLREEREHVIKAVLEMGHIPVGMEMFSAADEEQWRIIARHIDETDYYVVVVAHRYGSVTDDDISYTRKEYEYARQQDIPCLGFIIADDAKWTPDRIDADEPAKTALIEFKGLIREKPVSTWKSAEDLHGKVSIALSTAFTASPRQGWVRASDALTPKFTTELTRLSSENADLRKQLREAETAVANEQRELLKSTWTTLNATHRSPSYRYEKGGEWQKDADVTLFDVFFYVAPSLIAEASTADLSDTLAMNIRTDHSKSWNIVAKNQLWSLLADLMTLDLVRPSPLKHSLKDENEYWSLTTLGTEFLKYMHRFLLKDTPDLEAPEDEDTAVTGSDHQEKTELEDSDSHHDDGPGHT